MSERTSEQREAAESRDRDVFLRAGAGTGKTKVLVDRFSAAALDEGSGVERILAFTFTERAADQLRRRVREELAGRAAAAEGEEREALLDAAEASERAWISTIHGFCRRLLASHPAAAGIDPRFRVVDEPEADRLAARAFEAALEEMVEAGGAEALELAAANRPRTLLGMTRGAYDELRSHGDPEPALPPLVPPDTREALAELVDVAREAHLECADATGKSVASRDRIGAAAALDPASEPGEELLRVLQGLSIASKADDFKGEACERYTETLKRTRAAVAASVLGPAYEQLRELIARFGRRYEDFKAERSALDFEDLQLRAVALLRSSDALRERYREQFRHLMVDEFQDTNGLQLGLIEQLRGPDTRLFLVGDEFQSIYGFRHADVEIYRREHRRFAEGHEPRGLALPLTGNFRAAPGILALTNAIGAGLLDGFEPLSAAVSADPPAEPITELLLTSDDRKGWDAEETGLPMVDDDPSPAPKVAEARRLAARLRELADAGEDPAEMVVLLRAFTHVAAFERALTEAGLDPYVVGGRGFWSQQQIEDLRSLLAVVANPLDDEALFGALASPACAVLPDTLWLLRKAATVQREDGGESVRHVWPVVRDLAEKGEVGEGNPAAAELIPEEELERVREFARELSELRLRATEGGLEALVDRAATAFGYDLAALTMPEGRKRWSNARKLMRLAREFEAREGPDLAAFLDYLDSRAAQRDRESEAATRAEGHSGVRVMTVHAAKGLEFEVVAVADLGRNLQLGWTPLRVAPGEDTPDGGEAMRVGVQLGRLGRPSERLGDYQQLTDLAATREAEEEARLAYVAATRAKRRLLLSGTFNPQKLDQHETGSSSQDSEDPRMDRRKPITLQLIRCLLDADATAREVEIPPAAEGFPSGLLRVEVQKPEPGAGTAILVPREREAAPAEPAPAAPPLGRPEVPPALIGGLSYSALSGFKNCGYRFYVERVLGIAEPDVVAGDRDEAAPPEVRRRFGPGLAVHSLLEWSARNRWREPNPERVAAGIGEQGLDPTGDDAAHALALVRAFLASPLKEEIGEARVSAEVPFVISVGDTLIRGSIDLLVERGDGSVLVVDYKTDRLQSRDPADVATRYSVQRDLYALAASGRGGPVETAYVFLERPDHPVRETFDPADLEAARARVEALLGRLAEGRFDVTDRPHRALCADCPARERLCSHEAAAQMRDDPDPPIEPSGNRERAVPESAKPQLSLLEGP
ncbi:MAG TPA: UvrD-helicase domain-containing protein [Solirubrobacterales bacterium]|nr:UvrD-helicase domain-containing protein [Solirubrobacterales bacterium]